jgi:transposase
MKLVSEYETSGLQQKDFCAKHDVSLNTLQYWLYKRTRRSGSDSGPAGRPPSYPKKTCGFWSLEAKRPRPEP